MTTAEIVRDYYNSSVEGEWNRIGNRPEFLLTCRFLDRYCKPGDTVLDIGGGPGRYSLYLAQKGCDVTLLDLSDGSVAFALARAAELGLPLKALSGDACAADELVDGPFDHVLLMGPLYHLLEEHDRVKAVEAALRLLKTGGELFASFISLFAGIIYAMKFDPACLLSSVPCEMEFLDHVLQRKNYAGDAFTRAFFIEQRGILPFMSRFPLEKLHLFGQEGVTSPCEQNLMDGPGEVAEAWLDFCERTCEREELLSWSEHHMYIGRKR